MKAEVVFRGLRLVAWTGFVSGLVFDNRVLTLGGGGLVLALMVKGLFRHMRKSELGNDYSRPEDLI